MLKRFPRLFYITLDNGFTAEFHCSRAIMGYAPAPIEHSRQKVDIDS